MHNRSFFGILGQLAGSSQQENQFSRTFLACFQDSQFFRRQIVEELYSKCRIRGRRATTTDWKAFIEVPTPLIGGGRIDIRIDPSKSGFPIFYLESKLGSPLTVEQLRRYRKHGVDYLIAVTKYSPKVSATETRRIGAFTLRWQDVHRRLSRGKPSHPRDRFVRDSMLTYMEELGMAYRENLTLQDLEICRRVLSIVSNRKYQEYSPVTRNGFELFAGCFGLLEDVWHGIAELHPKLAAYHLWGPGYFNSTDAYDRVHAVGWDIWRKKHQEDNLAFRLWLSETRTTALNWTLQRRIKGEVEEHSGRKAVTMTSGGNTISQDKLVRWIDSCIRRWRFT